MRVGRPWPVAMTAALRRRRRRLASIPNDVAVTDPDPPAPPAAPPAAPHAATTGPVDFGDRVAILALAARRRGDAVPDDNALLLDAQRCGPEPERRLSRWARRQREWSDARAGVERASRRLRIATVVTLIIAAALGWFAGGAALSTPRDEPLNVVWLVQGILLGQSVLLLLWLALQTLGAGAAWASIGGLVTTGLTTLLRRVAPRDGAMTSTSTSTWTALLSLQQRGAIARWSLGAATHSIWSAFNIGCLLAVALRLTFHRYTFCWESTWLPEGAFAWLCAAFGAGPALVGIPTPDAAMVAASERGVVTAGVDQPRDVRQAWTGFLLGSIVIYGVLPRAALAMACLALRRRAVRLVRLDPTSLLLDPILRRIDGAVVERSERVTWPALPGDADQRRHAVPEATGAPAIVAIEMPIPASGWPPAAARAAEDLGVVASGDDRRAALDRLARLAPPPARVVVAVSLAAPPDRGIQATIEEFVTAAAGRVHLILSGGDAARRRLDGAALRRRIEGWRALAQRARIDEAAIDELDLDLLTASSGARLRAVVEAPARGSDGGEAALRSARGTHSDRAQLDRAFSAIAEACSHDDPPDPSALLRLQSTILSTYTESTATGGGTRSLAALSSRLGATVDLRHASLSGATSAISGGATRMLASFPPSLAGSARWATVGAIAGGLGCLALASAAAPAIGSAAVIGILSGLPGWMGAGAGGGALARLGRVLMAGRGTTQPPSASALASSTQERVTAITAAALWTVTLELQGSGESMIAEALKATFPAGDEPGDPGSPDGAHAGDPALNRMEQALAALEAGAVRGPSGRVDVRGTATGSEARSAAITDWLRTLRARLVEVRESHPASERSR